MKDIFINNIAKSFSIKSNKNKKSALNYYRNKIPYLWFFTDQNKYNNYDKILKKLPKFSGVVIRDYNNNKRNKMIKNILNISKKKSLTILVGSHCRSYGNINGLHLPQWNIKTRKKNKNHMVSISAHSLKDQRRILNSKADIIFLSSLFFSTSHPERKPLGIVRFGLIARNFCKPVIALGGISKNNIKRLKNLPINGIAAIDLLN